MKKIYCHIDKCLACRSCELACAVAHSGSKNLANAIIENPASKNFIRVQAIDEKGNLQRVRSIALQCRHCEEPKCLQACITGGIYKDNITGKTMFDTEKCVACWSCIMVCPFGGIVKYDELHRASKCDYCPDLETPACVNACPTKALFFCEFSEAEIETI